MIITDHDNGDCVGGGGGDGGGGGCGDGGGGGGVPVDLMMVSSWETWDACLLSGHHRMDSRTS